MTRYITYARDYIHPLISEAAAKKIKDAYLDMRKKGMGKKIVSATPRQLESLIRISEAFAKMRLSNEVSEGDVEEATRLIQEALKQAATDPTTGLIDMNILATGKTAAYRKKIQIL